VVTADVVLGGVNPTLVPRDRDKGTERRERSA
jgi:hypothetical protein